MARLYEEFHCNTVCILLYFTDAQVISAPSSESLVKSKVARDPLKIPKKHRSSSTSSASSASSPPPQPSYQHQLSSSSVGATPSAALQLTSIKDGARIEGPTSYSADFDKSQKGLYERFISLLKEVQEFIVSREINLKDIILFLTSPPSHLKQDLAAFLSSQRKLKLSGIESIEQLFIYLGEFWDEKNPALLVHLVNSLKDATLIEKLRAYQEDLKQYCDVTPINHAPEVKEPDNQSGQSVVRVQLPEERSLSFLSYVMDFIEGFKRVTGCGGPVRYRGNQYSSICIIFSIPCPLAKEVFDCTEVQEFLKENHILCVHIDDECVFEVSSYQITCTLYVHLCTLYRMCCSLHNILVITWPS